MNPAARGPEDHPARPGLTRRGVFRRLALAGLAVNSNLEAHESQSSPLPLPALGDLAANPERFWTRIRHEQFLLDDGRIFLNPGSLGVMPRSVLDSVVASLRRGAEYATDDVVRWGYEQLEAERTEMAGFLGCDKGELAFTHNCTEAMSIIANGLDLLAGDEVIITNQEHPSGQSPWRLKAARHGIVVREIEIPVSPKDPGELSEPLLRAISPKTRVLMFSGITSTTGLILPAREICDAARSRGVLTIVDGAHMDGQVPVDLHSIGCDFFTGSPHKWLFAPPGCGLLYGRGDSLQTLWPCVATGGWDNKEAKAGRFMMIGTNNRSTIDGMLAGVRFAKQLTESVIYSRIHEVTRYAMNSARARPYIEVVTPDDSRFFHAMLSIRFKSEKLDPVWTEMRQAKICLLAGQRMRLSFHIHTRKSDIDRFFGICDRHLKT